MNNVSHRVCTAPMMDWTDRHCRYFHRLLSPNARLYTEMVTAAALAHGDLARLLTHNPEEHPVALQVGGAEPRELALAARLGGLTAAQRRYAPASITERREAVAASKVPGAKVAPDNLPGVSLAEAAKRLGITESQVRTRADRGEIKTVTATYRGREVRRIVLD